MGDGEALGLAIALAEAGRHSLDRLLLAGEDDRAGAVDRGDRERLLVPRERLCDLLLGGLDRDHRPALGQRAHQPAPGGDQLRGVGEVEDAGDVGGGDLADRVAGEEVGTEAEGFERPSRASSIAKRAGWA